MASSPNPRYYKDGYGCRPRWRLFFHSPRWYLWLILPDSLRSIYLHWKDRRYP